MYLPAQTLIIEINFQYVIFIFGFVFFDYIGVIIAMIIGAISGSWVATNLRDKIDGKKFTMILKVLLSALAIQVIVKVFL